MIYVAPPDMHLLLKNSHSSMEWLPTEQAIVAEIKKFSALKLSSRG